MISYTINAIGLQILHF